MKRQVFGFVAGTVVGFVIAREGARRKQWGAEFRPKRTPLRVYRQAISRALGDFGPRSRPNIPGGLMTFGNGITVRLRDYAPASGVVTVEAV